MRVLFIEDNSKLGEATRTSLVRSGFAVDLFATTEDGWHAWQVAKYDVVVLDIMLGRDSGLDILARARASGFTHPVLLLTALGSVDERVRGLDKGADDYLIKPFAIEELVARIKALGRRPLALQNPIIQFGDIVYDAAAHELRRDKACVSLSRGESIVLERFLRAPDRVIAKDHLGESLHSLEQDYTENSIEMHVHRVRRKLADLGSLVSIRALRGLGYIITANANAKPATGKPAPAKASQP